MVEAVCGVCNAVSIIVIKLANCVLDVAIQPMGGRRLITLLGNK